MKIIADEQIPLLEEYFAKQFELQLLPTAALTKEKLKTADILICRSVTKVNQSLLADSKVKIVATPASGTDHLDKEWLEENKINYINTPGCNALAVSEYIVCVIAYLRSQELLKEKNLRAGIIGIGNTGTLVVEKLKLLGFNILENDPVRAESDSSFHSTPLASFKDLDLISIHAPLTRDGKHPTQHLIKKKFLQQQKENCIFINTARGSVIKTDDLTEYGKHLIYCLDVYENEPSIDKKLVADSKLCTPHIAGHSIQSRLRTTYMLYQSLTNLLQLPQIKKELPVPHQTLNGETESLSTWEEFTLAAYNPYYEDRILKQQTSTKELAKIFPQLRQQHNRYEFNCLQLTAPKLAAHDQTMLRNLNFNLIDS